MCRWFGFVGILWLLSGLAMAEDFQEQRVPMKIRKAENNSSPNVPPSELHKNVDALENCFDTVTFMALSGLGIF